MKFSRSLAALLIAALLLGAWAVPAVANSSYAKYKRCVAAKSSKRQPGIAQHSIRNACRYFYESEYRSETSTAYHDCIMEKMPGVTSPSKAHTIRYQCKQKAEKKTADSGQDKSDSGRDEDGSGQDEDETVPEGAD
jgi:hypothetical protein